jgi:alkylhydroperoxidase/carboxymuconolactone decarboxylase family protein YurZ
MVAGAAPRSLRRMVIETLLARPGLAPAVRTLVGAAVSTWRAAWPTLGAWVAAGRACGQRRADFEETLLQAVLFCGFPRAITAFEHLHAAWPPAAPPAGGAVPAEHQADAGRALFHRVYGRNTEPVAAMLRSYHADLHAFVLDVAYGRVLARPHLDARVRELLAAALLAVQDQPRQFAAHARGALRCGASETELHEAVWTALEDDAAVASWLRRR